MDHEERRGEDLSLESDDLHRTLADTTFEGILLSDNGIIIEANEAMTEIGGYSREELRGRKCIELILPQDRETVMEAVKTDSDVPYLVRGMRKDGGVVLVEVRGKMIPFRGQTIRVSAVRDISREKQREEDLRRSEERYRLVAQNLHDVIWTTDLDLNYTYMSPSVERQRGFSPEEAVAMPIKDVLTPESLARVYEAVKNVLKPTLEGIGDPDASLTMELDLYRKDGSIIQTETTVSLLMDSNGVPFGLLGVSRDITERKAADAARAHSEELFRLLAENVDDIIFTVDNELNFSYVSPSVERVTAFTVEETKAKGWQEFLAPSSLEQVMEVLAEDALGITGVDEPSDRSISLDVELNKKDGGTVWSETIVTAVKGQDGEVQYLLGVARDITERRRAHEQFLDEKKRSELYLDLFGHDIRNINQGIMSYLELMLMNPSTSSQDVEYIRSVLEQATRINDLVAKVQRLTQLRTADIQIEDVEARAMLRGAVDFVTAKYHDRKVVVNVDPVCNEQVIRGSNLLHDVFKSILDNAARFDRHDQVVIDITYEPSDDDRSVRFRFGDRGPGIPDEMKGQVFRRLDLGEGIRGSGLGLTVVWEIVKRLDGRVWVEDRVEGEHTRGSTFVVELPRSES